MYRLTPADLQALGSAVVPAVTSGKKREAAEGGAEKKSKKAYHG